MLKLKFPLRCNGKNIRSMDALRVSFSPKEILEHYKSGGLVRWLKCWRYDEELAAVEAIQSDCPEDVVRSLASVFGVTLTEEALREVFVPPVIEMNEAESESDPESDPDSAERESFDSASLCQDSTVHEEPSSESLSDEKTRFDSIVNAILNDTSVDTETSIDTLYRDCQLSLQENFAAIAEMFRAKNPGLLFELLGHPSGRDYYLPKNLRTKIRCESQRFCISETAAKSVDTSLCYAVKTVRDNCGSGYRLYSLGLSRFVRKIDTQICKSFVNVVSDEHYCIVLDVEVKSTLAKLENQVDAAVVIGFTYGKKSYHFSDLQKDELILEGLSYCARYDATITYIQF